MDRWPVTEDPRCGWDVPIVVGSHVCRVAHHRTLVHTQTKTPSPIEVASGSGTRYTRFCSPSCIPCVWSVKLERSVAHVLLCRCRVPGWPAVCLSSLNKVWSLVYTVQSGRVPYMYLVREGFPSRSPGAGLTWRVALGSLDHPASAVRARAGPCRARVSSELSLHSAQTSTLAKDPAQHRQWIPPFFSGGIHMDTAEKKGWDPSHL